MRTNHSVDLAVGITLPPTLSNLKVLMPRNTHTHTTLQNMQYKIQTVCIYAQGRHQPHSASLASLHSTPARYKPDNLVWHIQSEKHKIFSSLALTENDQPFCRRGVWMGQGARGVRLRKTRSCCRETRKSELRAMLNGAKNPPESAGLARVSLVSCGIGY